MSKGRSRERGSTLIEFSLVGVPLMLVACSVMAMALSMWQFHTLEFATQMTTRYIAMHGRTCVQDSSTCIVTVGDIASYFAAHAIALDPAKTNLTLKSATATTNCNPLSSCNGNASPFPNSNDNGINFDITLTASYSMMNPVAMFRPSGSAATPSTLKLFAMSRQRILY
jgi:Flp pilus assembly protein TadG